MTLPSEEILMALETNAQAEYERVLVNFAWNNLVHIAIVAKAEYPDARFVGLSTSDQDMEGNQFVLGVWDKDGEELVDDGEDFDSVPMNIWDRNLSIWEPCLADPAEFSGGDAERYLDIDKIEAAYETWKIGSP